MKVIATRKGYYDLERIEEGQEFELKDQKDFSENWMRKLDEAEESKDKEPKKPAAKGKNKTKDEDDEPLI